MGVVVRDFEKAAKLARGQLVIPDRDESIEFYRKNRIKIARTIEDVREFMDILFNLPISSVVSLDTETTGLDGMAEDARVITIQMGYRDPSDSLIKALVIPLWHRENKGYDPNLAWISVKNWLESERPKVLHHAKFDLLYIYHTTGIKVKNVVFDTMLILHAIDSGAQGTYSLKAAVRDRLPHLGFQNYEDLLPKLTKTTKAEIAEAEDED
jgi:DNA polymerase I-like protein with 3'-5' exonuclease and polymerase domains